MDSKEPRKKAGGEKSQERSKVETTIKGAENSREDIQGMLPSSSGRPYTHAHAYWQYRVGLKEYMKVGQKIGGEGFGRNWRRKGRSNLIIVYCVCMKLPIN